MVYRIYVEKKKELAHEAHSLYTELKNLLGISSLTGVRILNRYDAENIDKALFDEAVDTVFSEPQLDIATPDYDSEGGVVFAVEYLTKEQIALANVYRLYLVEIDHLSVLPRYTY